MARTAGKGVMGFGGVRITERAILCGTMRRVRGWIVQYQSMRGRVGACSHILVHEVLLHMAQAQNSIKYFICKVASAYDVLPWLFSSSISAIPVFVWSAGEFGLIYIFVALVVGASKGTGVPWVQHDKARYCFSSQNGCTFAGTCPFNP